MINLSIKKRIIATAVASVMAMSVTGNIAVAKTTAIKGGTVHTLGKLGTLNNATILIEDGHILAVGQDIAIPADAEVIDATGQVVVPGFMNSGSQLGLSEISMTQDSNEHSSEGSPFSAAFDVRYGLKTNSVVIDDNRRQGLTHAISQPSGSDGMFSGSSAVIALTSGPDMYLGKGPMIVNPSKAGNRSIAWEEIRLIFDQVKYYDQNRSRILKGEEPSDFLLSNLNMEALVPVVKGKQKLVLYVDSEDGIRQAIAFKKDTGVDLILSGAEEAWKVAAELAKAKIPVIINPAADLPVSFGEVSATLENAALLDKAGVEFAISPDEMGEIHNAYLVNQMAGIAVAHGLNWDKALASITLNPARIFGIDSSLGSIEKGKVANIVIWDGDPLEVTSNTTHVWVEGVEHPLVSRRTMLRDRYLGLNKRPFAYH